MVSGCVLFAPGLPTKASHRIAGSVHPRFGVMRAEVPIATDAAKRIAAAV